MPAKELPWWELEPVPARRRTTLPDAKLKQLSAGEAWKLVKHLVGSNSLDLPMPMHMTMPIDELHRRAEELEYSELLDQAAKLPKGSIDRLLLVAAFSVSAFQSVRNMRCSLPVMGETVEMVYPEKRMRLLVETSYLNIKENRVINAWVAEGEKWMLEGEDEPSVKIWPTSLELHLNWLDRLTFSDGDVYTWKKLTTGATIIKVIGTLSTTYKGTVVVHNEGSGLSAHMAFKESGVLQSVTSKHPAKHQIVGHIEKDGAKLYTPTISGRWDQQLTAHLHDGSQRALFKINDPPQQPNRYNLASFSLQLNEMTPGLEERLPPTDARRRWDLRALEDGRYEEATAGKEVLEVRWRQREAEYCARTGATSLPPRWFEPRDKNSLAGPPGEKMRFRYKGGYWEARVAQNWEGIDNIFAPKLASE